MGKTMAQAIEGSMSVNDVVWLLGREYGPRPWSLELDPISTLIVTILSQHTSSANTRQAFEALISTFKSWEEVAEGDIEKIAESIRSGGLARVKASRIKLVLREILERQGSFDLSFLGELPVSEAKSWLRELPGVGPKTAGCVLLFGLGKPALPVDTHVYRVAKRLGLISATTSLEQAHELLEGIAPPQYIYQFHVYMVEHGRRICKAQRPRCHSCVLKEGCPATTAKRPVEAFQKER